MHVKILSLFEMQRKTNNDAPRCSFICAVNCRFTLYIVSIVALSFGQADNENIIKTTRREATINH